MKTYRSLLTVGIFGRELTANPFILSQIATTDRGRLVGYAVFQQCLSNDLVWFVLLLDAGIEHLSRCYFDNIADVAAVIAFGQIGQCPPLPAISTIPDGTDSRGQ